MTWDRFFYIWGLLSGCTLIAFSIVVHPAFFPFGILGLYLAFDTDVVSK